MVSGNYLTTSKAAQLLGISRVAVFKKIREGKIVAKKQGRNYLIPGDQSLFTGEPNVTEKTQIASAVARGVKEYGDVFRWLGNE